MLMPTIMPAPPPTARRPGLVDRDASAVRRELRPRCRAGVRPTRLLWHRTLWTLHVGAAGTARSHPRPISTGTHVEHAGAVTMHHPEAVMAAAVVPASPLTTTRVGTEEVAGEEDRADDEDDACHDADPRGDRGETAVAWS